MKLFVKTTRRPLAGHILNALTICLAVRVPEKKRREQFSRHISRRKQQIKSRVPLQYRKEFV